MQGLVIGKNLGRRFGYGACGVCGITYIVDTIDSPLQNRAIPVMVEVLARAVKVTFPRIGCVPVSTSTIGPSSIVPADGVSVSVTCWLPPAGIVKVGISKLNVP